MSGVLGKSIDGYIDRFSIERKFDDEVTSFDLEIVLSEKCDKASPKTVVHFADVRDLHYSNSQGRPDLGAFLELIVEDISRDQLEGIRLKVECIEGHLALYCRSVSIAMPDSTTITV
jgi:hypothetical protein